MPSDQILAGVQALLHQAAITGEKLSLKSIAHRIGCSRTVLYTNDSVRAVLVQQGIIDSNDFLTRPEQEPETPTTGPKEPTVAERRLRKAEERASRLEILLAEAQEQVRALQADNESLRMRLRLVTEGRSIL